MNLASAHIKAIDNTRTWAEIRQIIDSADTRGVSKNNGMTRAKAADMLLTQVIEKDPYVIPVGHKFNKKMGKNTMTGEGLLIANILREFG